MKDFFAQKLDHNNHLGKSMDENLGNSQELG